MSIDLNEIKTIRDEILDKLEKLELDLNSSRVQLFWENHGTTDEKTKFVREQQDVTIARGTIENSLFERIAGQLKSLESDLKEGCDNLQNEIGKLNDTVAFLNAVSRVAGILARILLFA